MDYSTVSDAIAGLIDEEEFTSFTGTLNGYALPFSDNGVWNLTWEQLSGYGITNDGSYDIYLTTTDTIGNTQTYGGLYLTVNNVAPETDIDFNEYDAEVTPVLN